MNLLRRACALFALAGICVPGFAQGDHERGFVETDLVVNQTVNGVPTLTDANGVVHLARFADSNLVNPWGLTASAASPFWVADNGAGESTLYNTPGTPQPLVVSIPSPGDPLGTGGAPTGVVFNTAGGQQAFTISGVTAGGLPARGPAAFLFATEDGTILGWNPAINPPGFNPAKAGRYAIIAVDNSAHRAPGTAPVYKGLALATDATGATFLYAANFRDGTVDVFDSSFTPVTTVNGAFIDPSLPRGYAPFNIAVVTTHGAARLFVTYAVQNAERKDDVAGEGHGIVDTFDLAGHSLQRFAQHGQLNSPWGMALAPAGFGDMGGTLLIGNFGNGHINAFDPDSGRFVSKVRNPHGQAIAIDGLWSLRFGNGVSGGLANTLYFTAGPNHEADGLFGSLSPE